MIIAPFGFAGSSSAGSPSTWRVDKTTQDVDFAAVGETALHDAVREDDSSYIMPKLGGGGGITDRCMFTLADIDDPGTNSGFTLKIGHEGVSTPSEILVYIRCGGVDIMSSPAYITIDPTPGSKVDDSIALAAADIQNITDFHDVEIRFVANRVLVDPDDFRIYYAYIDLP